MISKWNFNPRAPCGARQHRVGFFSLETDKISIHAPHAGRDQWSRMTVCRWKHFNPRAPCGARHSNHNYAS